ncbi:unnamed protein product [Protopolystoma xenopodis]|uniref:Uncharacterized protein n=1 Tax=Protopolystoma xenopodis TaxID=117903 RepID=A0A448X522_9PLAT|nr:unnamed protein product [Protopolystoma xenopodis]
MPARHLRMYQVHGPTGVFSRTQMYTNISDEKPVITLLEVLECEEDILDAEWLQKESLTRLINLIVSTTFCIQLQYICANIRINDGISTLISYDRLEKECEKSPL